MKVECLLLPPCSLRYLLRPILQFPVAPLAKATQPTMTSAHLWTYRLRLNFFLFPRVSGLDSVPRLRPVPWFDSILSQGLELMLWLSSESGL